MKKSYLILAAAAALFAACSSDSNDPAEKQTAKNEPMAIGFDSYVGRSTTRAGMTGTMTNADLQKAEGGFGVFAYYSDNKPYSETSIPNFMYNQKVTYTSATGNWDYDPIKYWPNEFGDKAISEGVDKLTFFAYAPYVAVTAGTGRVTGSEASGIVGLTSNTTAGDPYVKYIADLDPDNRVDLCWGVAKAAFSSTVTGATANNIAVGAPYIDLVKPQTDAKIAFDFKHALASLNVQIDADVDVSDHSHGKALDGKTKIYVRSVSFEGFTTKGLLNLNAPASEGPKWYELSSINTKISGGSVTIYDGRRDGKESQAGATAPSEEPTGLNTTLTPTETTLNPVGVTNDAVNLFAADAKTAPIFVIPTGEKLKVNIVYDVETKDDNLSGYLSDGTTRGSAVENSISKTVQISSSDVTLVAGKSYVVKLHLGMTSVKVEASVSDWVDGGTSDTDLPYNN